jgi:hypothetical protein
VPSYLTFNIVGQQYGFHHYGSFSDVYVHVHLVNQIAMLEIVKVACSKVASNLCSKLSRRFLDVEVMVDLGMVYPQYWICEETMLAISSPI